MSEPEIAGNAPIAVDVEKGHKYFWCACGKSKKQPFCDGSHQGSEFAPFHYIAKDNETVYFCVCKRTGGVPLCDGSHKKL